MPLNDDELKALGVLFDQKLEPVFERFGALETQLNGGFDELFKLKETLENEYAVMNHQVGELQDDVRELKKKVA